MMLNARDPKLLESLDPQVIAHHLQQHYWKPGDVVASGLAQVWRYEDKDNRTVEVLLPLDRELGDFALRMADVVETVAQVENRNKIEILGDWVTTISQATIQGIVTRLQENADAGKVTVMGVIAGQLRRIQMELSEPAYDIAIKAYQARIPVICSGSLRKNTSGFVLSSIERFTLDLEGWMAESA